jgi:hypothetical protein
MNNPNNKKSIYFIYILLQFQSALSSLKSRCISLSRTAIEKIKNHANLEITYEKIPDIKAKLNI